IVSPFFAAAEVIQLAWVMLRRVLELGLRHHAICPLRELAQLAGEAHGVVPGHGGTAETGLATHHGAPHLRRDLGFAEVVAADRHAWDGRGVSRTGLDLATQREGAAGYVDHIEGHPRHSVFREVRARRAFVIGGATRGPATRGAAARRAPSVVSPDRIGRATRIGRAARLGVETSRARSPAAQWRATDAGPPAGVQRVAALVRLTAAEA